VTVRDIYKERNIGVYSGSYSEMVDAHGVVALKLTPIR
jgi:hypothetical protein